MKKFLLALALAIIISCVFALTVGAVTTYDDAPVRTKYQANADDIVEFYDGFKCPVSYVFKDTDWIDKPYGSDQSSFQHYFDFEYINGKTGKSYTMADVKGFDIPQGIKSVAIYAGRQLNTLKWISFPSSVTSLAGAIFQSNTGLEECTFEFDENHPITKFPGYTFFGCKNLKSFSMPDCFTRIDDKATFSGCTNLGPVYLSKNLTEWVSSGGGSRIATFDDCVNMYFVNEPFEKGETPEKPTVYRFPANLKITDSEWDFSKQSTMRCCSNLNDVLVFGKYVTSLSNAYLFQGVPTKSIVFLGDMTLASPMYWGSVANVVFANENDKNSDSVSLVPYTTNYGHNCSYYFCSTGTKYLANKSSIDGIVATEETNAYFHIKEKSLSTEANCIYPEMTADYCFCGAIMGEPVTVGEALGHNLGLGYYVFTTLTVEGYTNQDCSRCDYIESVKHDNAVLVELGYSVKLFELETGASFENGYSVDKELLKAYETTKGVTVSFGVAFNSNDTFSFDGTLNSFKLYNPIKIVGEDKSLGAFMYKINYADNTHLDSQIVIGIYACEKSDEGEALTFVNTVDGAFVPVSYNSIPKSY